MKAIAIIVLICLSRVHATETSVSFFEQIAKSDFGKTLLEAIQVELRQDNPIDHIIQLLQSMKAGVEQDQDLANALSAKRAAGCTTRLSDIDDAVAHSSEKRAEDEKEVPLREEESEDRQKQADDKNGEEQRNLDRIALITNERAETRKEYEDRRDELVGQIAALQEAKTIVSQLKKGAFLQETSEGIFTEIRDHHQTFLKKFPRQRGYHQLIQILMETVQDPGVKADQGLVAVIVEIIDGIVESLYELQKVEMLSDDQRESDFQTLKANIESQNSHLQHTIATLNANVLHGKQKLLELSNDINTQTRVLEAKARERADWEKTCKDEQSGFAKATQNRQEQLSIINQALEIFFGKAITPEVKKQICSIQISA